MVGVAGAAEAYRKKRWLDYDGLFWCTLDGVGNTGTYMKPLTDQFGHAKIVYHVLRMLFQNTLAGSGNVDTSGPGDVIPVRVLHCGPARQVDVTVRVRTPAGQLLAEHCWPGLRLPAGRVVVPVAEGRIWALPPRMCHAPVACCRPTRRVGAAGAIKRTPTHRVGRQRLSYHGGSAQMRPLLSVNRRATCRGCLRSSIK